MKEHIPQIYFLSATLKSKLSPTPISNININSGAFSFIQTQSLIWISDSIRNYEDKAEGSSIQKHFNVKYYICLEDLKLKLIQIAVPRLIFPFKSCFMNGISTNKITAADI